MKGKLFKPFVETSMHNDELPLIEIEANVLIQVVIDGNRMNEWTSLLTDQIIDDGRLHEYIYNYGMMKNQTINNPKTLCPTSISAQINDQSH